MPCERQPKIRRLTLCITVFSLAISSIFFLFFMVVEEFPQHFRKVNMLIHGFVILMSLLLIGGIHGKSLGSVLTFIVGQVTLLAIFTCYTAYALLSNFTVGDFIKLKADAIDDPNEISDSLALPVFVYILIVGAVSPGISLATTLKYYMCARKKIF
ncbi:hypothetical protein QR680_009999 [Steinernema hermaphroditum]|uniref:Uncharacterized protein n=1 Tax=Steinernema hermaphroditum TaxID=289476 RepID=A0AA39MAX2_9BILA|nr:hypothetical protein QR680_009999 [Steinernema hermaphroditum]